MTREYLVVYEKSGINWSAFSPDVPGCGSLGDSLEETHLNMQEALALYMDETVKAGEPIPDAVTTTVNFDEFDPEHATKKYFVEWVAVPLPQPSPLTEQTQAA